MIIQYWIQNIWIFFAESFPMVVSELSYVALTGFLGIGFPCVYTEGPIQLYVRTMCTFAHASQELQKHWELRK